MAGSYLRRLSAAKHGKSPQTNIAKHFKKAYSQETPIKATFLAPLRANENAADVYSKVNREEHRCFIRDALSE